MQKLWQVLLNPRIICFFNSVQMTSTSLTLAIEGSVLSLASYKNINVSKGFIHFHSRSLKKKIIIIK